MSYLVDQGKAFYWGTSEWSAVQIMEAYAVARREQLVPPTMEQPQYNMFHREKVEAEYERLYREIGLGTTIWSPLAGGLLTGKYNDGMPEGTRSVCRGTSGCATCSRAPRARNGSPRHANSPDRVGAGLHDVADGVSLGLLNPNVSTVITGASRPEQVVENMAALNVAPQLTPEVVERIEAILANRPAGEPDFR